MSRFYRSVWISDVHLCTRDCQAELLYTFLDGLRCDYLYLVGDIIDVWALKKKWIWPKQYNEVVHKVLKRSRHGARVIFIPGNHDEFFRAFIGYQFGDVEIVDRAVHQTADGRKLLVIHGDEFDAVVVYHKWLSLVGHWAYGYLTIVNRWVNRVRTWLGMPYWSLSGAIKRKVKSAVSFMSRFEEQMVLEAKRTGVDGVVCGHIHQPVIRDVEGIVYCNTGDWIENCTALVEHESGRLEMIYYHDQARDLAVSSDSSANTTPAQATIQIPAYSPSPPLPRG